MISKQTNESGYKNSKSKKKYSHSKQKPRYKSNVNEISEDVGNGKYEQLFYSLLLLSLCSCVVFVVMWSSSVCEVVIVPIANAVVAVTLILVLLFVLHVCMLRECEGPRVTVMLMWGTGEVWLR